MKLTTLCYIENNNKYLMLHRTKKEIDSNKNKWIGVGGRFEPNETPEECLLREVCEETGLSLTKYQLRGIVTFISDIWETEYMFLYTANEYTGELKECDEGELAWIDKNQVLSLNTWEGDKIFLKLLSDNVGMFELKLKYNGEQLVEHNILLY
jgi:8-oxo-dGTP diphosphatase